MKRSPTSVKGVNKKGELLIDWGNQSLRRTKRGRQQAHNELANMPKPPGGRYSRAQTERAFDLAGQMGGTSNPQFNGPLGRQFERQSSNLPSPEIERRPSEETNSGFQSGPNKMADWRLARQTLSANRPQWEKQGNQDASGGPRA